MKTIKDLEDMYRKETSLYKKVYIYAAIQKLKKRHKEESLENDILKIMTCDGEDNGRNKQDKRTISQCIKKL